MRHNISLHSNQLWGQAERSKSDNENNNDGCLYSCANSGLSFV